MDKKLNPRMFTNIFMDTLPAMVSDLPEKAFDECIKSFDRQKLNEDEIECLSHFTKKYLSAIDYTLINFSKKVME